VTNSNHQRASAQFAEQFSVPIFARSEPLLDRAQGLFRGVADGDDICDGLLMISIEGAAPGEIALHYLPDGGTLIIGDALISF
jgi:hypothetical protein